MTTNTTNVTPVAPCTLIGLYEKWRQDWRRQWQAATNILLPVASETTTNLAMTLHKIQRRDVGPRFTVFFFFCRVILWVSLGWVTWAEYRSPRPERALRMCAGGGRVLSVPSLLHWAESNLPFFEYLLWERCLDCCRSHPTFTGRQRRRWLAAATHPNPPILSGAHLPARLSWLPTGNWDIPTHSPLITKVTWHMYSWRWANLHCGHIFPRPLSVSARCPFEASLPSQVIKDPVVSHLAGPIIKSET